MPPDLVCLFVFSFLSACVLVPVRGLARKTTLSLQVVPAPSDSWGADSTGGWEGMQLNEDPLGLAGSGASEAETEEGMCVNFCVSV